MLGWVWQLFVSLPIAMLAARVIVAIKPPVAGNDLCCCDGGRSGCCGDDCGGDDDVVFMMVGKLLISLLIAMLAAMKNVAMKDLRLQVTIGAAVVLSLLLLMTTNFRDTVLSLGKG